MHWIAQASIGRCDFIDVLEEAVLLHHATMLELDDGTRITAVVEDVITRAGDDFARRSTGHEISQQRSLALRALEGRGVRSGASSMRATAAVSRPDRRHRAGVTGAIDSEMGARIGAAFRGSSSTSSGSHLNASGTWGGLASNGYGGEGDDIRIEKQRSESDDFPW